MLSISQRDGIRQLPGVCLYPAKGMGIHEFQGGTADIVFETFVLDRRDTIFSIEDFFYP